MNTAETINNLVKAIATSGTIYDEIMITNLRPNLHLKPQLISEICTYILEKPQSILKVIQKNDPEQLRYFFATICKNQVQSDRSDFHYNNRQTISYTLNSVPIEYTEDLTDLNLTIDSPLDEPLTTEEKKELLRQAREEIRVDYFESEMFKIYFDEGLTYREIEEKYNISYILAFQTVKKVKQKLKELIKLKQNGPIAIYNKRK